MFLRGQFYCLTRYSDFASLYDILRTDFDSYGVEGFPPKKPNLNISGLTLSSDGVEQRRLALEDFFKKGARLFFFFFFFCFLTDKTTSAFEVPQITDLPYFIKFFHDERAKYLKAVSVPVKQDVETVGGDKVTISIQSCDSYAVVMQATATALKLDKSSIPYFALFLRSPNTLGSLFCSFVLPSQ